MLLNLAKAKSCLATFAECVCIQRRDLHSAAKSCLATFAEEDLAVGTTCNLCRLFATIPKQVMVEGPAFGKAG